MSWVKRMVGRWQVLNSWLILTKASRGKCTIKQQTTNYYNTAPDKIKSNQQQCDRSDTNKGENITAGSVKREKRDAKLKVEGGRKKGIMAETA